jgi:hypothetical protein
VECACTAMPLHPPQKFIRKYKKLAKFGEIDFFLFLKKSEKRVLQTHFWRQ